MTFNVEGSFQYRQLEFKMACSASRWPQRINFAIDNQ